MSQLKIALVEYINTLPFLAGITNSYAPDEVTIIKDNPAACFTHFFNKQADIALLPVATLPHITRDFEVLFEYGIACLGAVDTVVLLSDLPVDQISTIYLDSHSKTSANLVRILCKQYWKVDCTFEHVQVDEEGIDPSRGAYLLIGDKVKAHEASFKYKYDLGTAWMEWKKLPFVFAIWVVDKSLPQIIKNKFIAALEKGATNIDQVSLSKIEHANYWQDYLMHKIKFKLDASYRQALNLFLNQVKELEHDHKYSSAKSTRK